MSYAKFSEDSDVYVYSDGETLHCQGCSLNSGGQFNTEVSAVMLAHMKAHLGNRDRVPSYAISRLEGDAAANKIRPLSSISMHLHITTEAMEELFEPLAPCPECQRPLPVPFEDNYQHWDGCSVGELEKARAEMHCLLCGGPCGGPCEEGDLQFKELASLVKDE